MYISKSRFINWTRCPMYYAMELKRNPAVNDVFDEDLERREERLAEVKEEARSSDSTNPGEEEFDSLPGPELQALLPYYKQVEEEALKVARKYFRGTFVADSEDPHNQKLFEYEYNGKTYRCYVDIYNENDDEINIIEVKATTSSKFMFTRNGQGENEGLYFSDLPPRRRGANYYPLFVKEGNIWHLNYADSRLNDYTLENFNAKNRLLLNRYRKEGKYPHDLAFQRFVIEHALSKEGNKRKKVNYYLAVLNSKYVYDGAVDVNGRRLYNEVDGQELITFLDMNETTEAYQPTILEEIAKLEGYISTPHDIGLKVDVGAQCAWGEKTECSFWKHCFQELRDVPDTNRANNYIDFRGLNGKDKYQLINDNCWKLDDVPIEWLRNENHIIQRNYYANGEEWKDKDKMRYWLDQFKDNYPIYHFDFETFPCPLPRFRGESPYQQSGFEFSLHIEREPGVCDKDNDNFIFLNENFEDDEREELVKAIINHFEFNDDGTLKGTMLAQYTTFEKGRLEELAKIFPKYAKKLLAIRDKSADIIHLLRTNEDFYSDAFSETAKRINYYQRDLSGSYSIKKTLPVLVPELTYKGMDVGNGTQAYIAFVNYDSEDPTVFDEENEPMRTKAERRAALKRYCQQDTWAMVEILRAVRAKIDYR